MVIITDWKFWINAYEELLTIEDNSDAQASWLEGAWCTGIIQLSQKFPL